MSRTISVPDDLYDRAAAVAAENHVSVEEFFATIVTNRLASREYIQSRAKLFDRAEFEHAFECVPDVEPEDHDRL